MRESRIPQKKTSKSLAVRKKMPTFAPANRQKGASLVEESLLEMHLIFKMVPVVQLVRASDCGSECRRFESVRAPKVDRIGKSQ